MVSRYGIPQEMSPLNISHDKNLLHHSHLNLSSMSYHISPQFKASLAWYFHVFEYEKSKNIFVLAYLPSTLLTREANSIFLFSEVSIAAFESKLSLGRMEEFGSALGNKNSMQSGTILKMLWIKIANQSYQTVFL